MFRTRITFEPEAIVLDDERVPFALIEDADVIDNVLVLSIPPDTRRVKLSSHDAMPVLDAILDGIARAHPQAVYRSPAVVDGDAAPGLKSRPHRRRASVGGSVDLMIGRTFTAG